MVSAIREVKARGAHVLAVTYKDCSAILDQVDEAICIPRPTALWREWSAWWRRSCSPIIARFSVAWIPINPGIWPNPSLWNNFER